MLVLCLVLDLGLVCITVYSHRAGLANISYTHSREKGTGKKNGKKDGKASANAFLASLLFSEM